MKNETACLARLDRFGSILGILAFATLIIRFGFPDLRFPPLALVVWSGFLPVGLFLESLYRLLIVSDPWRYLSRNPVRYAILFVIVLEISGIAGWSSAQTYSNPGLVAGQIYLAVFLFAHMGTWVRGAILANRWLSNRKIPVLALPAITFAAAILSGALLLWMPGMHREPTSLLDNLFTATSALCVTGLTVYDVGSMLTPVGQTILAILIQVGGIGTMTIMGMLTLWYGGRLSIGERMAFSELVGGKQLKDTRRVISMVIKVVAAAEAIGAILLWSLWRGRIEHPLLQGVFHSVSAFCNAGFCLFPNSLAGFSTDILSLLVFMALIASGGIGFPVISNLWQSGVSRLVPWRTKIPVSRTSKLVLAFSAVLIIVGACAFYLDGWLAERPRSLAMAFFQSVTTRTAGFQAESQSTFGWIGWSFTLLMMTIGASPQSTGGGMKTTVVLRLFFRVDPKEPENRKYRYLPRTFRIASLLAIAYALTGSAAGALISILDHASLRDAFFESFSALGTVGLSRDLTPLLSPASKLAVMALMFTGRVLYPTFVVRVIRSRKLPEDTIEWA